MRVFISADIEGTAGITDWDEAMRGQPGYPEFRELMTAEVIAACEGAKSAGARDILVKDAHQTGRNLILERLPPYVRVLRGWSGHPHSMMTGVDGGFDAAIFTGYHDAAGTESNPLAHSFNGRISRMTVNGEIASEFTLNAMTAAYHGVAPVFISGDAGICEAAKRLAPKISTCAVSQGFGPATLSMTPEAARAAIRDGVESALTWSIETRRLTLPAHFALEIEFNTPVDAYRGSFYPGVAHPAPRILRFEADDWFEILRAFRFISSSG